MQSRAAIWRIRAHHSKRVPMQPHHPLAELHVLLSEPNPVQPPLLQVVIWSCGYKAVVLSRAPRDGSDTLQNKWSTTTTTQTSKKPRGRCPQNGSLRLTKSRLAARTGGHNPWGWALPGATRPSPGTRARPGTYLWGPARQCRIRWLGCVEGAVQGGRESG